METEKVHGTGNFVPNSVRIVDFNVADSNLLVRGGSAFGAENFTMTALIAVIQADSYYACTNITLHTNPMIIDFCLVGYGPTNYKDQKIVEAEVQWFNPTANVPNGSSGPYPTIIPASSNNNVMVYWPVLSIGGTVPTSEGGSWDKAAAVDQSITIANNGYNYSGLVPAIFNALNNNPSQILCFPANTPITNAIVYVHCDSGINRTGAAIIGYLMRYGSNIQALNIAHLPASPYHSLKEAQNAERVNPPCGDAPPGGVDQAVPEAYCNLINTGATTNPLSPNCVPLPQSVNN